MLCGQSVMNRLRCLNILGRGSSSFHMDQQMGSRFIAGFGEMDASIPSRRYYV